MDDKDAKKIKFRRKIYKFEKREKSPWHFNRDKNVTTSSTSLWRGAMAQWRQELSANFRLLYKLMSFLLIFLSVWFFLKFSLLVLSFGVSQIYDRDRDWHPVNLLHLGLLTPFLPKTTKEETLASKSSSRFKSKILDLCIPALPSRSSSNKYFIGHPLQINYVYGLR